MSTLHVPMMRSFPRRLTARSTLPDLTPIFGVCLVLLIIALVQTPASSGPMYPAVASAQPAPDDRVTVGIDPNGNYFVFPSSDLRPVSRADLPARLREAYRDRHFPAGVLNLKAGADVRYGAVLDVVDAAREVGVQQITAIVQIQNHPAQGHQGAGLTRR